MSSGPAGPREGRNSQASAEPLFFGAVIHQILGDREGVELRTSELAQISGEAGFRIWQAGATILQACEQINEGIREHLKPCVQLWRGVCERWRRA